MLAQQVEASNEFMVQNYQIHFDPLLQDFHMYDPYFFFCPKNTQTVIEMAIKMILDEITNYDPLKTDITLMNLLVRDIEVYQSKHPHPELEKTEYIDNLELICDQIEQHVSTFIHNKLPANQQCKIMWPKWIGNTLTFTLALF